MATPSTPFFFQSMRISPATMRRVNSGLYAVGSNTVAVLTACNSEPIWPVQAARRFQSAISSRNVVLVRVRPGYAGLRTIVGQSLRLPSWANPHWQTGACSPSHNAALFLDHIGQHVAAQCARGRLTAAALIQR